MPLFGEMDWIAAQVALETLEATMQIAARMARRVINLRKMTRPS